MTPAASILTRAAEKPAASAEQPQSVILLWLNGGPSQLETFDPHPGKRIAAGSRAIKSCLPGVLVDEHYPRVAEQLHRAVLVRSVTSREADHNRGVHVAKTGYPLEQAVDHPSIGAICCHQLPVGNTEIPRHISIIPGGVSDRPDLDTAGRGGFLGAHLDAFRTNDPLVPIPDVQPLVDEQRIRRRLEDAAVIDRVFAAGRQGIVDATKHHETLRQARKVMSSEQLAAFDVRREPAALLAAYGNTPFGRGCLAARRLVEVGVRCIEVCSDGWDSHAQNHSKHDRLSATLDPALAALLEDLAQRDLLKRTIVMCCGEFGRTPEVNRVEGRDHWRHGFTVLLAGGPFTGGKVIGATDPEGSQNIVEPYKYEDIHATVLTAMGIDPHTENITPQQRPLKLSEGVPIAKLLA